MTVVAYAVCSVKPTGLGRQRPSANPIILMELPSILLGLALFAGVAFLVAQPLLQGQAVSAPTVTEADQLAAQRDMMLTALRDLDFDFNTGKITAEDYHPQRAELVQQGVNILKQLDALSPAHPTAPAAPPADLEAQLEAAISARRRASG